MAPEHVDVVIVGAGLSGIGAAAQLKRDHPGRSVRIVEARDRLGGTWDLFRYPGVRSDSDMFTLGYSFKPWEDDHTIAPGPAILGYVRDTADEYDLERNIRYGRRVTHAAFSSETGRWTLDLQDTTDTTGRSPIQLGCSFLYVCSGYYRYTEGYTPALPGLDDFAGTVVHPQHWPEGLDYAGKRIVVIGSGATAVTLVPALAGTAAHVTMLQRSPSYIAAIPAVDTSVARYGRMLPHRAAQSVVRQRNILRGVVIYQVSQRLPSVVKRVLRRNLAAALPDGFDVDRHFTPAYKPWDQRLCATPDGDFFAAIRAGRASVVTDGIRGITPTGIRLDSGGELPADIIVTATGLNLLLFGDIRFTVDGEAVDMPNAVSYKGMMISGMPNFAFAIGYTNASWTLKINLVNEFVSRLLSHMDRHGYSTAVPRVRAAATGALRPLIDFSSGYVQRSIHTLPRQGSRRPWRLYQNYYRDALMLRRGRLEGDGLEFGGPAGGAPAHADRSNAAESVIP